jgi:hypothetical protein
MTAYYIGKSSLAASFPDTFSQHLPSAALAFTAMAVSFHFLYPKIAADPFPSSQLPWMSIRQVLSLLSSFVMKTILRSTNSSWRLLATLTPCLTTSDAYGGS